MSTPAAVGTGAILLAGGRGSRMGGITKPLLELGGRSLLRRAVDAVEGCAPVTVAAEVLDPALDGVDWVREDPPLSGPASAIVAVLAAWRARRDDPEWAFVLASDLVHPDAAVAALLTASAGRDGVCLLDGERPQWLAGLYRVAALQEATAAVPDAGRDAPARALLGGLTITFAPAAAAALADVDTWQDLDEARVRAHKEEP